MYHLSPSFRIISAKKIKHHGKFTNIFSPIDQSNPTSPDQQLSSGLHQVEAKSKKQLPKFNLNLQSKGSTVSSNFLPSYSRGVFHDKKNSDLQYLLESDGSRDFGSSPSVNNIRKEDAQDGLLLGESLLGTIDKQIGIMQKDIQRIENHINLQE